MMKLINTLQEKVKTILIEETLGPPLAGSLGVNSHFSKSRKLRGQKARPHRGTDYSAKSGTRAFAIADGKVTKAKVERGRKNKPYNESSCGGTIMIKHDNGNKTLYCHMSSINVKKGDRVEKGQVIGLTGGKQGVRGSGNSLGPHLHFQLKVKGSWVDPVKYINQEEVISLSSEEEEKNESGLVAPEGGLVMGDGWRSRKDMKGKVKGMQSDLIKRNYILPRFGVDGKFGPETLQAVNAFQNDYGLEVGEIVTSEMLAMMKNEENKNLNPDETNDPELEKSYKQQIKSDEAAALTPELIVDIINNTISAGGSKEYNDLFLDSNKDTAVGILHFTKRGLKKLYEEMDTQKYFGKSVNEMKKSINKYDGEEMNDPEWKKGMEKFLSSSESETVQNRAATKKFTNGLKRALSKGKWSTPREYAIGMFYLNSYPKCLNQMGRRYDWDAEQMLRAYCSGECSAVSACRSRCNHINKNIPASANAIGYVFKGC